MIARCEILFSDGSGLVIVYKRLDCGRVQSPAAVAPGERSVRIEPRELAVLFAELTRR